MQAQALDKVATRLSVLEVTSLGMLHPEMAGVFGAGSAFTSLAAFTYEPSWGRFANVAMFGAFNGLGALAKGADGVFASQANEAIEVADNSMNGASLIIEMNDQQNEFTRTLDDAVRVRDSEIEGQEKR